MIEGDFKEMGPRSVNNIVNKGGTVLKSARSLEFKTRRQTKSTRTSCESRIDALVVIEVTVIYGRIDFNNEFDFPVMGIPGTIDNDFFGTSHTLGYD
jgi:6-phosphofructokinase 1